MHEGILGDGALLQEFVGAGGVIADGEGVEGVLHVGGDPRGRERHIRSRRFWTRLFAGVGVQVAGVLVVVVELVDVVEVVTVVLGVGWQEPMGFWESALFDQGTIY